MLQAHAFLAAAALLLGGLQARAAAPVDADSVRAALMAEEMAMNAPGRAAADFSMRLAAGGEARLADFRGAPLLLVLYDADCDDCRRVLQSLPAVLPEGLRVLAVYAEGDEFLWPAAVAELPQGWTAAFDAEGVYSAGKYSPEFLPGLYMLDAAGRVVARGSSAVELGL